MLRGIAIAVLVIVVGGAVGFLFHHNAHRVPLNLGNGASVELPMAAHLLGAATLGAVLVAILVTLRAGAQGIAHWRSRRQERHMEAIRRARATGQEHLWSGDFATASRTLSRAVKAAPNDLDAVLALSSSYEAQGDVKAALEVLEHGRATHGPHPRLLAQIGRIDIVRGNPGAAIDAFREADREQPGSPFLLSELAAALAATGQTHEAVEAAKRRLAAEREPTRRAEAEAQLLALRYQEAAQMPPSRARNDALKRLRSDAPDFLPPLIALAGEARADGDLRGADRLYRDALKRSARGVVLERLASLHTAAGQPRQAIGPLRDAATANSSVAPRLQLSRTLVAAGELDAAESELADLSRDAGVRVRDTVDMAPEHDLVAAELALARGNDRDAAKLYARAVGGAHQPFSYSCQRCGRIANQWIDHCRCGAFDTYEWIIAAPPSRPEKLTV